MGFRHLRLGFLLRGGTCFGIEISLHVDVYDGC